MPALEIFDQRVTQTATNVDSSTKAYPHNVTSGSLLLVVGAWWKATSTTLAVTDSLSTSYTVVLTSTVSWGGGVSTGFIAYGIASSGGANTVTVNPGGAASGNYFNYAITEVTGVSAVDATGSSSTGTSTSPSCSVTTGVSDALVVAVCTYATSGTITSTTPLVKLGEDETGNFAPYSADYMLRPSSATTESPAWTLGTSRAWATLAISFSATVSGGLQEYTHQRAASTAVTNVDSHTKAFPNNTTSGSLLIAAGAYWKASSVSLAVTDSLSTSYTVLLGPDVSYTSGTLKSFIAYGVASSGGANTVTVDPGGAASGNTIKFGVIEVGRPFSTPIDVNGGNSTGSSTTPSDSLTPTQNNTLEVGVACYDSSGGITPDSPWSQVVEDEAGQAPQNVAIRYLGTAGSVTASWVLAASHAWSAQTAAFTNTDPGGGGGGTQPPRTIQQHRLRRVA